jgi:RimJ/RimL family protein N-acetyltransferase
MALDKPPQCRWFQRAIRRSDDDALLGDVGFCLSDGQAEIGITIAPSAQGQGYAREALEALFHDLFGSLGVHRIYASVDPRNTPSMALLTAVGMRQEAHFRESLLFRGEWVDDVVFALLACEWRDRAANDAGIAASR